jgi:hypothetical protein
MNILCFYKIRMNFHILRFTKTYITFLNRNTVMAGRNKISSTGNSPEYINNYKHRKLEWQRK